MILGIRKDLIIRDQEEVKKVKGIHGKESEKLERHSKSCGSLHKLRYGEKVRGDKGVV